MCVYVLSPSLCGSDWQFDCIKLRLMASDGVESSSGILAAMEYSGVQAIDWEHVTETRETMRKILSFPLRSNSEKSGGSGCLQLNI